MYHTHADALHNIRPGTVQELGNNMMGAVRGFTTKLAERALSPVPTDDNHDAAYYFDVFWAMVVYPKHTAPLLHNAPLAMLLLAPLQMRSLPGTTLRYLPTLRMSGAYVLAVAAAVVLPAAAGALRALCSARPLVFFSHHLAGYALHAPLAAAALLCAGATAPNIPTAAMGAAWVWGLLGIVATRLQLGAAIYPFLWTVPVLLAITMTWRNGPAVQLAALLVCCSVATLVAATSGMTLVEHIMDKVNLIGAHDGLLGNALADAAVGGILGLAVVLATGVLAPAAGAALAASRRLRRTVVWLLIVALLAGVASSVLSPYDATHPKRVFCQHLHTVREGRVVDSRWVVATTDPYPPLPARQPGWSFGWQPGWQHERHEASSAVDDERNIKHATPADAVMKRYLYPLSALLRGVALPAPGPSDDMVPSVRLVGKQGPRREVEVDLGRPCWGLLNISARSLRRWSFTDEPTSMAPGQHLVRFAGNEGSERLLFWLEADEEAPIRIELTAKYFDQHGPVAEFGRQHYGHAPWVAFTGLLVYHVDVDLA